MSARLSMGLAMYTWIAACKLMQIYLTEDKMDTQKRSAIGGYAEKAMFQAQQLAKAIREEQTEYILAKATSGGDKVKGG